MKKIRYEQLPAVGPGTIPKEGTVVDLLGDIPYLLTPGIIPPMHVVNEVL